MVREDIVGMMKIAIQRGQNIQQTAQSLVNSGYPKNDVDEAVQVMNTYTFQPAVGQLVSLQKQIPPPKFVAPKGPTPQVASYYPNPNPQLQKSGYPPPSSQSYYQPQQFFPPEIVQRVSSYEPPKAETGKLITIIMVVMLAILLGILVTVFLFKPELTSFFNNL